MSEASSTIDNHPPACQATRKDGRPCTVRALIGSAWCFAHDPERAAQRAEARRKGGHGKARLARVERLVPGTLRPVLALLLSALNETHAGGLDPKVAGALAALAGAIVRTYQAGALEDRLTELEAQIATLTRDRDRRLV